MTFTITDAENCSITETFTIPDEHIDIEMELTDYLDDHCNQGIGYINLATTNGVAPYTFDWYRNGEFMTTTSEPILNNLFEGTYTIEATDVNTCTGTYEVILEDVPEPDAFFELRADVDFVEEIIDNKFELQKNELATKQDIANLKIEIANVRTEIKEVKVELLKWMFAMFLPFYIGMIVFLIKQFM